MFGFKLLVFIMAYLLYFQWSFLYAPETVVDWDRKKYIDCLITDQYFLAKKTAEAKNKTPTITNNKLPTKTGTAEFKPENRNMQPKTDKNTTTLIIALSLVTTMLTNLNFRFLSKTVFLLPNHTKADYDFTIYQSFL